MILGFGQVKQLQSRLTRTITSDPFLLRQMLKMSDKLEFLSGTKFELALWCFREGSNDQVRLMEFLVLRPVDVVEGFLAKELAKEKLIPWRMLVYHHQTGQVLGEWRDGLWRTMSGTQDQMRRMRWLLPEGRNNEPIQENISRSEVDR